MRRLALAAAASIAIVVTGCHVATRVRPGTAEVVHVTHGVAAGEVTATSAVVWARCERESTLVVAVGEVDGGRPRSQRTVVGEAHDYTGRLRFEELAPNTRYAYRAWCTDGTRNASGDIDAARGVFRTAPDPNDPRAVRFAWGGDVGGQNVCRDAVEGYPIFDRIGARAPDFFIALGDLVYADDPCRAQGRYGNRQVPGPPAPASDATGFRAAWKYNRSDPALERFLASGSYYAVWDDHEIVNDAGPQQDTLPLAPGKHLLPDALQAFLDYQPLLPPSAAPTRLYRSVRWGKHLELFLLDTRQYRDANLAEDSERRPKTMLGAEQRAWLLDALSRSGATWKVIVSSVPLSVPTGTPGRGRDGWANFDQPTGFEEELLSILRAMQEGGIRRHVWITTDVHFAAVFRYTPFAADPAFTFHEFITGPLHAGVFPKPEFDATLGPDRLFFHLPGPPEAMRTIEDAKAWFNFGMIEIDDSGDLHLEIVNGLGEVVYRLALH